MDRELYDLKKWAIETLKEYKAELLIRQQVTGKKPNELKKLDRFLNALAVDTEGTYADMMDDVRRKGLTKKQFSNMGRNLEERIMNSFRVLPDDPAHHMYSLRTAGDLVQNVEPGIREMGLQILKDEGYILGNVRQNLTSLAEATHQGRTGKGAELATLGQINVDKTKMAIAHPRGTGDPLISRTVDFKNIKTPEDFANAYRPLLEQQKADLAEVLKPGGPEAGRRIVVAKEVERQGGPTDIFGLGRSQAEVKAGKEIITKAPSVMQRSYQVIADKGSFRLSFLPFVEETVDAIVKNPLGAAVGAATAIEPEAVKSALQGNYRQAAEQTAIGAGVGAGIQQALKVNPVQQARLASFASKIPGVASRIPAALKIGAGVAKFAAPVLAGYAGYEALNAIVEGATGKNLQETGVAAEEKKEQLREEGYSDYELRRRARTGYRRP
jgi:hypothetical protein